MAGVSGASCSRQPVRAGRQASPVPVASALRLGLSLAAAEAEGAGEPESAVVFKNALAVAACVAACVADAYTEGEGEAVPA